MKHIKLIATSFAAITLLSVTIPSVTSVALAAEGLTEHQEIDSFQGLSDQELKDLGFSYIEIATYHDNMTNPVYIENGMILNSKTQQPRFPKNYNVVGGTTPKVLYNCDCFFVISPTRTALPGFSNASMTSNSSSNSCIV